MSAAALLVSVGRGLDAVAQTKSAAATAAALGGAARSLRPLEVAAAYGAGLDGATLDSTRLLALARGGVDALNAASHAGNAEATAFLTQALHDSSLFALVFRDARNAQAAVELSLVDETVAAFEAACRRVAQTITRPAKAGTLVRTVFPRADGALLHSFVLFREEDELLIDGFMATFKAEPCPSSLFGLYAETRLAAGETASDEEAARARLGERVIAAASELYIARFTFTTHNNALATLPASYTARMRSMISEVDLTPREFEGLFLTFGKHCIGVAVLVVISSLGTAGPSFARMLEPEVDGLARLLAATADPTLDEPSINACLVVLSFACERFAQDLVDKGAFKLLQPVIRHDNTALAVRACFAVATIAVSCTDAAEPLRWSGALELIASVLRPVGLGSVAIPGFVLLILPACMLLLQSGVEPVLQLAALLRLGAALTGSTDIPDAVTLAPMLAALRSCASSRDSFVSAAAKYVLKELRAPLHPSPPAVGAAASLSDISAAARQLATSKVERDASEAAGARLPHAERPADAAVGASIAVAGVTEIAARAPAVESRGAERVMAVEIIDGRFFASPARQSSSAAWLLASHGSGLDAVAQAKGLPSSVVAAFLGAARSLRPSDLCAAYAAGLDGKSLDSPRLLSLARGALESLNTASHAGGAEATAFLTQALHKSGLFALVFRDGRETQDAVELHLVDETVSAFELSCRRAAQTVTRPAKKGEVRRSIFTLPDGTPLHSFVLFGEEDDLLIEGFLDSYGNDPIPAFAFGLFAATRLRPGEVANDAAVARAQLGERVVAANSELVIAHFSVTSHNTALGCFPGPAMAHMREIASRVSLSPREFEGLFLTLGRHHIGVAALASVALLASSGPAFVRMLEPEIDGLARLLAALSDPALDEPSINGCLIVLSYACGHGQRVAQALVDKGAFTLLQPVIRHDNVALAVRACFAVASIAISSRDAAESLRWSGALEAIASALRAIGLSSVAIPGFLVFILPTVLKLLQPGVEPVLQLAALHRLAAALSGTNAVAALNAPVLAALRSCAASRDAAVAAAARYVLKELQQQLEPPVEPSPATAAELAATVKRLTERVRELTEGAAAGGAETSSSLRAAAAPARLEHLSESKAADGASGSDGKADDATPTEGKAADEDFESASAVMPGASAGLPALEEGATRGMLAEILNRGTIASDPPWPVYCRSSISEYQLEALAHIGAVNIFGAPIRPVALPEEMWPLFLPSTRAALVRYGVIE